MKAIVFANPEQKEIYCDVEGGDTYDLDKCVQIGTLDVSSRITTNTVRLTVGAMLAEALMPPSGWSIFLSPAVTHDPS